MPTLFLGLCAASGPGSLSRHQYNHNINMQWNWWDTGTGCLETFGCLILGSVQSQFGWDCEPWAWTSFTRPGCWRVLLHISAYINIYSLEDYAVCVLLALHGSGFKEVKEANFNISSKLFSIENHLFSVLQQFLTFTPSVVPVCQVKK